MNSDIVRAHGMTIEVSEQDLAEIERTIQEARPKVGPLRVCLASKGRNDPAPEAFDPPPGIMVDVSCRSSLANGF